MPSECMPSECMPSERVPSECMPSECEPSEPVNLTSTLKRGASREINYG